jgi:adenylylsulfate kinase-like enzyme
VTFKKGDPNINRKGAPEKEWTWASELKKAMEQVEVMENGDKKQVKEIVAKALAEKAQTGDVQAFTVIANRMDGMPKQAVDHTTKGKELPQSILHVLSGLTEEEVDEKLKEALN